MPTPLLPFACLLLILVLYLLSLSDEEIIEKEEEYKQKMEESEKELEEAKKEIEQKKAALQKKKEQIRSEWRAFKRMLKK